MVQADVKLMKMIEDRDYFQILARWIKFVLITGPDKQLPELGNK